MVFSRPTLRSLARSLAVAAAVMSLAVALFSPRLQDQVARAADTKASEETDPDYAIPDGTPKEIFAFLTTLQQKRPKFANREEQIEHAIKVQRAMIAAGDKILKQEPDEEQATQAVAMKLNSLIVLAANDIPGAGKEALDAVALMKQDANAVVAKAAADKWLTVRILNAQELNDGDRSALAEEILTNADKKKFDLARGAFMTAWSK